MELLVAGCTRRMKTNKVSRKSRCSKGHSKEDKTITPLATSTKELKHHHERTREAKNVVNS